MDPELGEYASGCIGDLAATRGWLAATLEDVRAGALLMIAVHGRDERVRASTVAQLGERLLPVGPIREVLALLGLLDDDRADTLEVWIGSQLDGLPGQTATRQLPGSGSRARAARGPGHGPMALCTPTSVLSPVPARVRRTLQYAAPGHDRRRASMGREGRSCAASARSAVRSLFRVIKARRLVFPDPARRIVARGPCLLHPPSRR